MNEILERAAWLADDVLLLVGEDSSAALGTETLAHALANGS